MEYLFASLILVSLAMVPVIFSDARKGGALVLGLIELIVVFLVSYSSAMGFVGFMWGWPALVLLLILAVVNFFVSAGPYDEFNPRTLWVGVPVVVLLLFGVIASGALFRANDYATMVGPIPEQNWSQDIQPKDPQHMRMSSTANAVYQAQKVLGNLGAIGSQFQVTSDTVTLQMINKDLWYVLPLDYTGFTVWTSASGSPGFVKVHAGDHTRQPEMVEFQNQRKMVYSPGAYMSYDLERHLRQNGFMTKELIDFQFEVDEEGQPWWVVTVAEPQIVWFASKVIGAAVVNPFTGEITYHTKDDAPVWIDRLDPSHLVKDYLSWWGTYSGGFWNSIWSGQGLLEPEEPNLIYGSDGHPWWVTGITSPNANDESLVGMMYTHSRTGENRYYKILGASTDAGILEAVEKNADVQYLKLHGEDPQIYNVNGTIASVVPLFSESGAFQKVAIVEITNIQTVALGNNQYEAIRNYEQKIAQIGSQMAFATDRKLLTIEGIVDRFQPDFGGTSTTYYLRLKGINVLFAGGASELVAPVLRVTQPGDRVRIEYYASGEAEVAMRNFANLTLPLDASAASQGATEAASQRLNKEEDNRDVASMREAIMKMTPEQLKALMSKVKK